ncbi:Chromosome segregation protein [Aspergillus sclerotialis]|uniref:Chromosome segregation protein n=1 Tax=Aspergillus sclerotialis TaxID=2070753 RepID=A0A3A3A0H8_9EURO|nr:Chromosome segregation protein [Aspergillus sclerotialis]
MAPSNGSAGSRGPRSRRSIAYVPRSRATGGVDKENTTSDIGTIQQNDDRAKQPAKDKKSRSKSLGPGGLDALQNTNGNRRKSTAAVPLKSILKPTVPVSPVRDIPSFEETRRQTPARGSQQNNGAGAYGNGQGKEDLLIDVETPPRQSGGNVNPFDTFNASSAIRDGKAAAIEREEREQRERERQMILEQREARRKSMANRRVSFAPEATLHTWNVVEIPDDSTSSSNSNSTRRTSSLTDSENRDFSHSGQSEPSSDNDGDSDIAFSPVHYDDLQQLRNRPASAGSYIDDHQSSSPFSGSSMEGSEDTGMQDVGREEDDDSVSGSDSGFDGESTAMSMEDMTGRSAATAQSEETSSGSDSSARLNEVLRQAAQEAGTKLIDMEENEDVSMEMADQEITGAFQPWIKKGQRQSFDWGDISALNDQENVDPSKRSSVHSQISTNEDEDLSMEVTNAIGGILPNGPSRRQSVARRKSSGEETNYDEQTMEFTNVVGGIAQQPSPAKSAGANSDANDEEMTMEFTSVVGGVVGKDAAPTPEKGGQQVGSYTPDSKERNFSEWNNEEDDSEGMDMEMTGAVGGILPSIQERPEEDDDQTGRMDITTAVGGILSSGLETSDKGQAKKVMEMESDAGQLGSSPFQENIRQSPPKSPVGFHITAVASESGSPSLASVRSRRRRSTSSGRTSTTPTSNSRKSSPVKRPSSPLKQVTPQVNESSTPKRTPPSNSNTFGRNTSPQKLFQPQLQQQPPTSQPPKSPEQKSLFENNTATGQSTPLFVFRPRERRSSGLGIDKEGLGSPRVAAMLDSRRSLGEEIPQFTPPEPRQQGVRFEDPVKLHEEEDREREEEENREDGHVNPPQSEGTALSLREKISSLTPKKSKTAGRKSLHVGSARGLLGKRPIELDEDEDTESDKSPKRLRSQNASPVKNVKLPPPPSIGETVGRSARSPSRRSSRSPVHRSRSASPVKTSPVKGTTTPTQEPSGAVTKSPLKDAAEPQIPQTEAPAMGVENEDAEEDMPPIQLQEFLNMTNIHFMELTTTKRRHTTAPGSPSTRESRGFNASKPSSFEDCVAAGFCTLPMLELYQHSCRELKSYISEGRQVIRCIEEETYADNPPLFREYVKAPPDIRVIMDNQFRNVKTHARLLSKASWYEWRMKLLDGLRDGLNRHIGEMQFDSELISRYEVVLRRVVPGIAEKHAELEKEARSLQQLFDEMESCDQDELREAREKLAGLDDEVLQKKRQLAELQDDVQEKTSTVEAGEEMKQEIMAMIRVAERKKEECRGWSAQEIKDLKSAVHLLEHQTGWSVTGAKAGHPDVCGPSVIMTYLKQLRVVFYPSAFNLEPLPGEIVEDRISRSIELIYCRPKDPTTEPQPTKAIPPIASVILKTLKKYIMRVQQPKITPQQLLRFLSKSWDFVLKLKEEARQLSFHGKPHVKLYDNPQHHCVRVRCTIINCPYPSQNVFNQKTRLDIDFTISAAVSPSDDTDDLPPELGKMELDTEIWVKQVYGWEVVKGISEKEMENLLKKEIKRCEDDEAAPKLGKGLWAEAVKALVNEVY